MPCIPILSSEEAETAAATINQMSLRTLKQFYSPRASVVSAIVGS